MLGMVLLTKHKEENFANIARGWTLLAEGGTLVCAGANDDGAASLEKHAGKAFGLAGSLSKFHCRVFWLTRGERTPPDYWRDLTILKPVGDGSWVSQPGIFAWDRIDDGSALLAKHLPDDLAGHIADFGCGWGYLSREILARSAGIERIDLIDAEQRALEAARANLPDPRASFHWLDIIAEPAPAAYDAIVCNPPFHAGRAAQPALGQGVIEAAAHALRPGGRFYMVANRGLPYEPLLKAQFTSFETLADNNKFRVTRAVR
jgi:16S rRNA (guanine1207-N2)-methyltransferase